MNEVMLVITLMLSSVSLNLCIDNRLLHVSSQHNAPTAESVGESLLSNIW